MAYWLVKTEPSEYSFADLQRDKKTAWTGVSNALALKHLREMKDGDGVLVYHTGGEKAIVGTAKVTRAAYPDPAEKNEKLVAVDLAAGKPLKRPVTLAEIKADAHFSGFALIRIGRLSVMPVTEDQWERLHKMRAGGQPDFKSVG